MCKQGVTAVASRGEVCLTISYDVLCTHTQYRGHDKWERIKEIANSSTYFMEKIPCEKVIEKNNYK